MKLGPGHKSDTLNRSAIDPRKCRSFQIVGLHFILYRILFFFGFLLFLETIEIYSENYNNLKYKNSTLLNQYKCEGPESYTRSLYSQYKSNFATFFIYPVSPTVDIDSVS